MSKKYKFAIIGGDRRQIVVAQKLLSFGHSVKLFGIDVSLQDVCGADIISSPDNAIIDSDVIILPLPVSRDNSTLNFVGSEKNGVLYLNDIIKTAKKNERTIILGGMIPKSMHSFIDNCDIEIIDYYSVEILQMKNALPSAEGAIMVAMENTEKNIEGMNVLISGYGRIGKLLAKKLRDLGANVTICARREEVLCEISLSGFKAFNTTDIKEITDAFHKCDVILNTAPGMIFNKQIIEGGNGKPIYIEIASLPGGIDTIAARKNGIPIVYAQSLPGKYAPINAGEYIFETICDILSERGMEI